jgi:AcrR family transcriptional regulator
MIQKPFHHGNLRDELLQRAEMALRKRGAETLSLRELARDAGVSHGAPRSHFADRRALLDALAERGFDRLGEVIDAAVHALSADSSSGGQILRAAGGAYLDFATQNSALLALMVASKADNSSGPIHNAATRLFRTLTVLVTKALGSCQHDAAIIERFTLLLSVTIQGICSTVVSGRIPAAQGAILLDDAVRVFMAGTR